jgi:ankyrin repeat protein
MAATPLLAAVAAQDLGALKKELAKSRAVPARAIMEAGRLAWQPGLALLAKRGGDLNASYRNYRALHALIQEKPHEGGSSTPKRRACLEWLLAHGADPEQIGAWPAVRALVVAAFVGEPEYVKVLRQAGARVDIFTAAALGETRLVTRALAKDEALATARDQGGITALQCSAGSRLGRTNKKIARGLLECAQALIEAGAHVDETVRTWSHDVNVLYFAIGSGQNELVSLLVDRGADPTSGLSTAVWREDYPTAELLLARGARIDRAREGKKPLLNELIRWGQLNQALWLLGKGASPNVADERGWTAVHQAVSRGNVRMLKAVLEAGGDREKKDVVGQTPIDLGRRRGLMLGVLRN